MFSPLRRSAVGVLRHSARSLSTTPDTSLLNAALSAVGQIDGGKGSLQQPSTPSPASPPPPPRPPVSGAPTGAKGQADLILIPPEEDPLLHFLTSLLMRHGERKKAANAVSRMLLHIHTFTRAPPLPIVQAAVRAASPACKVVSAKQGSKAVFKPMALSEKQRTHLGLKWILESCQRRSEQKVEERLAREMIDILTTPEPERNEALKKKVEMHKMAMRNRANANSRI